jgi:uncharacterized membrane protein
MNVPAAAAAAPPPSSAAPITSRAGRVASHRIATIDIVRGVVMILMAIDHVRVYAGVPAGGPTPGVFFTRWVTHFVAPAFIFLAGTAAFLHGSRMSGRAPLARFLLTRGLWLVLLELTFLRVAWTFNFDFGTYLLAGVIWVIGLCMILLAPLVYLPAAGIAAFGLLVICGHNLLDLLPQSGVASVSARPLSWLAQILYLGGGIRFGESGPLLIVLYTVLPWIGVMAAGYAFGAVMQLPAQQRRRSCLRLGIASTVLFVALRMADGYGDPRGWRLPPAATQAGTTPAPTQTGTTPAETQAGTTPARTQTGTMPAATQAGTTPARTQTGTTPTQAGGTPAAAAPAAPPVRQPPPALLRFLGTSKYPASLLFLLMTLGPMLVALALLEGVRGRFADVLATFGRVPLFYYLLHIPVIHLAAVLVSVLRTGAADPWLFANHPMMAGPPPPGYAWSLALLYLVTALVVALLYVPCRWFARLRAERRDLRWLSYL